MIRRAREEDLARVVAINNASSGWLGKEDGNLFAAMLESPHFLVAERQGEVCGFVTGIDQDHPYESLNFEWFCDHFAREGSARFSYVDRIAIDPSRCGSGMGKALYDALTHSCALPLAAEISIAPLNCGSVRFHERYGFKKVGELALPERRNGMYVYGFNS